MTNFRVTRIKPAFIHREVLAEVAADALAKLNPESRDGKRWANAIGKAVAVIEQNPQMAYDLRSASLEIVGTRGTRYTANGICQCEAYNGGYPCYHRAAASIDSALSGNHSIKRLKAYQSANFDKPSTFNRTRRKVLADKRRVQFI